MTLESRIRRFTSALMITGTLFFGGIGLASRGNYLNAETTRQEETQKRKKFEFKYLGKEKECEEKEDKSPRAKENETRDCRAIQPINLAILASDGQLYMNRKDLNVSKAQAQGKREPIKIPEGTSLILISAELQERDGYDLKFIVNDAYNRPLRYFNGQEQFDEFNTRHLRLRVGNKGNFLVQLRNGSGKICDSMELPYEIVPYEEPKPQQPEKPTPKPPIDDLRKQLVSRDEVAKAHQQRQKPISGAFIPRFGILINSENQEADEQDSQMTGSGSIVQGEYATPNTRLWLANLNRTSDAEVLAAGGRTLRDTFNNTSFGFETKLGRGNIGLLIGLEGNVSNSQYEPNRTPVWSPRTEKTTFYSANGRLGLVLGEFDKSFFEAAGFFGYGKLNVLSERPASYEPGYLLDSEWFKQTGYLVQGRLITGPFWLEGTYTNENLVGKSRGDKRTVTTLNGTAQLSMRVLSRSLKNLYIGAMVHQFDSSSPSMRASHTNLVPMITLKADF